MHFTVHLRSRETYEDDFSYGLVFTPCPIWVKGQRSILNLNPSRPDYCLGSVQRLIQKEHLGEKLKEEKEAIILVHPIGHGSAEDLANLQLDLIQEGFTVKVFGASENKVPRSGA